jgi:hypothetical protein
LTDPRRSTGPAVSDTVDTLILDLVEWIGPNPRPYAEVLEAAVEVWNDHVPGRRPARRAIARDRHADQRRESERAEARERAPLVNLSVARARLARQPMTPALGQHGHPPRRMDIPGWTSCWRERNAPARCCSDRIELEAVAGSSGSGSGAPAVRALGAQSWSPAVADIIGARRAWTVAMISSVSMPCK